TAKEDANKMLAEPVPLQIRNGVTRLMRDVGYGKGYQYAHDFEDKLTDMQCLPDSLLGKKYYVPTSQGLETKFKDRLAQIEEWKSARKRAK
ncbi:MAG: replication-associated recombination protein A, partial [Clostridia bacterium]|nr:replication-associated recombination protein A [Clostridia bacterium]